MGLVMEEKILRKLDSLSKSVFRSSFRLNDKEILYIKDKGMDKICEHANDFIKKRLGGSIILNDGKQTPMRGHPVFIAQHATATCCRDCLYKWHQIENGRELSQEEIIYIVKLLMIWIEREYKNIINRY